VKEESLPYRKQLITKVKGGEEREWKHRWVGWRTGKTNPKL